MTASKSSLYKLIFAGAVLLLVLGGSIATIYVKKSNSVKAELAYRDSTANAGPVVKAYTAKYSKEGKDIMLIGEARPYESATIYAKISGYLDKIMVDKGDRVTENQVLAIVDNPEIDQEYNAAKADLENKQKILERDKKLLVKNYISLEDEQLSETAVATATAVLKSFSEQMEYKTLRAPFTGTVTARYVDPGALIQNAINAQTSAQAIVTVATLGKLRIYVYVEQKDAGFLKNGYPVDITLNENPDLHLQANITRFAGELDPHTRMMLVEIDINDNKNEIVPGSYVNVHIKGPRDKNSKIEIPSNGLVVHKDKTMVAIIDKDSTLRYSTVVVAENNGDKVTLSSGLDEGELIALQVGENFKAGQKVRILQ